MPGSAAPGDRETRGSHWQRLGHQGCGPQRGVEQVKASNQRKAAPVRMTPHCTTAGYKGGAAARPRCQATLVCKRRCLPALTILAV
jgi:hypothetical protein